MCKVLLTISNVPFGKIEKFLFDKGAIKQTSAKAFRPLHRKGWLHLPDYEILERYNAEIRGILTYYCLASNFHKLGYFAYLMEYSCLATLAGKYDSSIGKIITKYKQGKDWVIKYTTSKGVPKEKRIVKLKDYTDNRKVYCNDKIVKHGYSVNAYTGIWARLRAGFCELCGKTGADYEVHHVPKVKDLKGDKLWEQVMRKNRRKTLVVCKGCHDAIDE